MEDLLYKPDKTEKDINELLVQHQGLVYHLLKKRGQLGNQDAESAAWDALWDAIGTFDIYGNTAFSTWAWTCILHRIDDVVRKQLAEREHYGYVPLEVWHVDSNASVDADDTKERLKQLIDTVFDEHMQSARGLSRDILQLWRASGFEDNKSQIARALGTSASYVSRVQQAFKARLSGRLKDL